MTIGFRSGRLGFAALGGGAGSGIAVSSAGAGASVSTSAAGLSSRSPLKAAWRTMPSPVQPANSISATSSGFSQCTFGLLRGAPIPVKGDLSRSAAFSRGNNCVDLSLLKPVPTRPT